MAFFKPFFKTNFFHNEKCYIGPQVPGHSIDKSFGMIYQVTKGVVGHHVNDKLQEIVDGFVESACNMGANAIINFRFETNDYESRWGYIILYGEAVILRD